MPSFETMINRMGQKPNEFWLFINYGTWSCHLKLKSGDVQLEIKKSCNTAEEALLQVWTEFQRLTSAMPEFTPAIEHRPAVDLSEVDEIPF